MIDVDIVDAHHHLCDLAAGYPWLEGPPQLRYHGDDTVLRHDYAVENYLADFGELPLVGSVHVENGAKNPLWEAQWVDSLCHSVPSVQVAKADLCLPDAVGLLEQEAAIGTVRGIRDILNWDPDPFYSHRDRADLMTDPTWLANFGRLEALGLSFDLQVFPRQLAGAARLAAAHPGTRIVLDHLGMPCDRDDQTLREWRQGIKLLAENENVWVKISAIGTTDHHWTLDSVRPLILETIEIFSPRRSMFASNFPVDGMYSTLAGLYEAFDAVTADFTREERAQLFGGTATEFYRIPEQATWPAGQARRPIDDRH